MIEAMLIAGLGGFVGTVGRYLTGLAAKKWIPSGYPWGTFIVNIVGCFIIGVFFGLWGRHDMDPMGKAFLISGFCGGFTTFSSFSHDEYTLLKKGEWVKFLLYLIPTVCLGLIMVVLGMNVVEA